jgi:hypothetical protein
LKAIKTLETLGVLKMTTSTNGSAPIFEIKKGTVIVFTAPFYRPIEDDEGKSGKLNFILLSFFLDIQRTNLGKVFVLSDSTSENFSIGTYLHTVRGSPSANHTLINMLEPSYILYPYRRSTMEGILLSSTRVPEPNYPPPKSLRATTLDDLYSNRIFGKVATLVSKPNLEAGDAYSNGYFVVRSDAAAGSLSVPDEHLHAKDVCKGAPVLESNYDLTLKMQELHPDRSMQLVQAVLGTTAQPTYEDVFLVFRLLPKADYIPLCLEASAKRDPVAKEKDKFVGGPEAFTNPDIVTFVKAEVNGDIFRIRSPVEEVKADWLNELYTDEEARFLNSLNLRPVMLEAIFPSINDQPMWQKRVAGFLENIAFSKCFSDDSLMLRRECMTTRDFINKVYFYFIDNSLRADTLREFEKAKEQAASKQLLEQMDATKAQELRKSGITPDYSEAAAVGSPQDFSEHKRSWKTLDVWEDTIKKEKYAYVMMINKKTGEQEYRSVSVPAENYPDIALAQQALMNKIEDLRRKYTGHFFIY